MLKKNFDEKCKKEKMQKKQNKKKLKLSIERQFALSQFFLV